uniref:Ig-like domain-containing protein n=1 Tax=Clastoptera arizonana TaxID=38151 RepID=A0A1B6DTE2_9HEMI
MKPITWKFGFTALIYTNLFIINSFAQGPAIEVQAILNGSARLPCDTTPPLTNDSVLLVVWYQNDVKPVYSYDLRGKNAGKPNHWKDDILGNRAYFRTVSEPATLSIENIRESDEADYRCRVDFRKSPTRNYKVKLTVIVLPQKPRIFDDRGSEVNLVAGPYEEGQEMKLTCKVSGGKPLPKVRWWRENSLIDSKDFLSSESVKSNVLVVKKMDRSFLHANYTCTASNNNISQPLEDRVLIEMHLKPLSAQIITSVQPLSADRKYEIVCQSLGSRPRAHITWWKDNKKLSQFSEIYSEDGNITTSTLTFTPTLLDHDKMLTCRAENDRVSAGEVEEDSWKLNVYFLPVLQLDLGSNMNPNDIEEGDDVYFECKMHANPAAYKVVWKHNNQIVQQNLKSGVIVNRPNMALQGVNRYQAGNYTCAASNVEGDGESNTVQLRVMYKPVCKTEQKRVYGVARLENARVLCEVDAVPKLDSFHWTFNNSAENTNITSTRYHSSLEHGVSTLEYQPMTDLDYGTVMCWGVNLAGRQKEPCVFHIIAAGRPDPPFNCTLMNQTTESLDVECIEGFDGGQPQSFQLEVFEQHTNILRANKTSRHANFTVDSLAPGKFLRLVVYAFNSKGRSESNVVEGFTLVPEKRTGIPTSFEITPLVVVLLVTMVTLIIVSIVIAGFLRIKTHSQGSPPRPQVLAIKEKTALTLRSEVHDLYDDKNPDLIPCNKDSDYQLVPGEGTPTPIVPQDSAPPYEDSLPPSHNIMITRNGDVYNNYKNRYAESHLIGDDVTYAELCLPRPTSLIESKNTGRMIRDGTIRKTEEPTIYAEIDHVRRPPLVSPPHREIVTVRTPLMTSDQESCV